MGNRRGLMLSVSSPQHQASPSARPPPPRARGRGLALRWHSWQVRVVRARGQASRRELAPHSALVPSSPCLPCPESRASSVRSSRPVVLRRSSATLPRADSQQRAASATTTTCRHLGHRAGPRHLSSSSTSPEQLDCVCDSQSRDFAHIAAHGGTGDHRRRPKRRPTRGGNGHRTS